MDGTRPATPQLYYHRLGAKAEDDCVVMQDDEHPDWRFDTDISDDGSVLLISVSHSASVVLALLTPLATAPGS